MGPVHPANESQDREFKRDSMGLINTIKSIVYGAVSENKYKPQTMYETLKRFYLFRQDKYMTDSDYLEKFRTLVENTNVDNLWKLEL